MSAACAQRQLIEFLPPTIQVSLNPDFASGDKITDLVAGDCEGRVCAEMFR